MNIYIQKNKKIKLELDDDNICIESLEDKIENEKEHIEKLLNVSKEESEMLKYKNFGRKSLTELVAKLSQLGLKFGMDIKELMEME